METMRRTKKAEIKELHIDILIFILIFGFLIFYYKPELLLLNTATTGGDTGSDNYLAKFMATELIPKGEVFGWSQGRWAGYPIFQFIFPLAYIFMSLLSYIGIPLTIAFKLITALPNFLIPVSAYITMRWLGFKFPTPIISSALSLIFLFQEKNNVFGGNIPSNLAGEFSYALSMGFMILFLGFLFKKAEEKKFSLWLPALYFLTFFSHLVTAIIGGLSAIFFVMRKEKKEILRNFKFLFLVFGLALSLLAFWLIPLLSNIEYTTKYGRDWGINLEAWYPKEAIIFVLLGVYALARGFANKDRKILFLGFCALATIFAFFNGELLFNVNVRFVPLTYFFLLMLSAAALGDILPRLFRRRFLFQLSAIAVCAIIFYATYASVSYIPGWIKWNYEGWEKKADWQTFNSINQLLKGTDGRGYVDLADINNRFGTPRAFESMPYFSGRNTLEGVYAQATITSPFISYTQCEISHHCAGIPTIGGKEHTTGYNFSDGTKHLKMLNVKYLVATFDRLQSDLGNSSEWEKIGDFKEWKVFKLNSISGSYISVPAFQPNFMKISKEERKVQSLEWWMNNSLLEFPVVMDEEISAFDKEKFAAEIFDLSEIRKIPIENNCAISNEKFLQEEISFATNCPGKPHIISVSYFPNWQSAGGEKIYYASPSFMLIFPKTENVKISFSPIIVNYAGSLITLIGILAAAFIFYSRKPRKNSFLIRVRKIEV